MIFQWLSVFSPGPRQSQCEWFLHNIDPCPYPCSGSGDASVNTPLQ